MDTPLISLVLYDFGVEKKVFAVHLNDNSFIVLPHKIAHKGLLLSEHFPLDIIRLIRMLIFCLERRERDVILPEQVDDYILKRMTTALPDWQSPETQMMDLERIRSMIIDLFTPISNWISTGCLYYNSDTLIVKPDQEPQRRCAISLLCCALLCHLRGINITYYRETDYLCRREAQLMFSILYYDEEIISTVLSVDDLQVYQISRAITGSTIRIQCHPRQK